MSKFYEAEQRTKDLVVSVISARFPAEALEPCNIFIEEDVDGAQLIRVGLCYRLSATPIDPEQSIRLLQDIHTALSDAGDERLAIVEHYFEEQQKIKGFDIAC